MDSAAAAAITTLINAGTPITVFARRSNFPVDAGAEFHFRSWKNASPSRQRLRNWKPGDAVAVVSGHTFDVVDVDPRNGGHDTFAQLMDLLPEPLAILQTPSPGGLHYYVPPTGFPTVRFGGIDYLGRHHLAYIPPTQRPRHQGAGYVWLQYPQFDLRRSPDSRFVEALMDLTQKAAPKRPSMGQTQQRVLVADGEVRDLHAMLSWAHSVVATCSRGNRNSTLNRIAYHLGKALPGDSASYALAEDQLLSACHKNGLLADSGPAACIASISSGYHSGQATKEN